MGAWRRVWAVALACCVGSALTSAAPAQAAASWLPAQQLSATTAGIYSPVVAAAPDGTVIAAWVRSDGTNYHIAVRVRPPGGSFSPVQDLSAAGGNPQEPTVAFDSLGNAIVAWVRSDGTNNRIQWTLRPAGGSFGLTQNLSPAGEDGDLPQ